MATVQDAPARASARPTATARAAAARKSESVDVGPIDVDADTGATAAAAPAARTAATADAAVPTKSVVGDPVATRRAAAVKASATNGGGSALWVSCTAEAPDEMVMPKWSTKDTAVSTGGIAEERVG